VIDVKSENKARKASFGAGQIKKMAELYAVYAGLNRLQKHYNTGID